MSYPADCPKMSDCGNVGEGAEQRELIYNFSGGGNWYSHVREPFGNIQLDNNENLKYFPQTK